MTMHLFAAVRGEIRRPPAAKLLLVFVSLLATSSSLFAAQASAQFDVMITLRSDKQNQTGQCDSTAPPMIVCGSRPPGQIRDAPPRGYRFISYITGSAGSVDIFTAAGTSTAFRMVNWADREYIEMTVGW